MGNGCTGLTLEIHRTTTVEILHAARVSRDPPRPRCAAADPPSGRSSGASRLLVRLAVVALARGLVGGGWYLAKKGFGRNGAIIVVEELHKRGVEASVRRLTLDPFRGLIARDVRIYDYKKREEDARASSARFRSISITRRSSTTSRS